MPKNKQRIIEMIDLFRYGFTLQEIGDSYSITRERVRQILSKNNISREEGGIFVRSRYCDDRKTKQEAKQRLEKKEKRIFTKFGCSLELYEQLRSFDKKYNRTPLRKFIEQRRNAALRGIKWDLTLAEWWSLWEGKYHLRGRCKGQFVMSRLGDNGSYSIGNVEIVTCTENIIEYYEIAYGGDYSETLRKRHIASKD